MRANLRNAIEDVRVASALAIEAGPKHPNCKSLIRKLLKARKTVEALLSGFPEEPPIDLSERYQNTAMPGEEYFQESACKPR